MNWTSIGNTLAQFGFTALGTAIGGPIGGIVAAGVQRAVAEALGVEETPEAIQQAIAADPAAARAKLAPTDEALKHEVEMARVGVESDRVAAEDRANSREMIREFTQENKWQAAMPTVITFANWSMAVGIVIAVAMDWLREDGIIVGFAIGAYTASNQFWLGSSSGSQKQSSTMQAIATSANTPSAAQVAGRLAGQAINKAVTR